MAGFHIPQVILAASHKATTGCMIKVPTGLNTWAYVLAHRIKCDAIIGTSHHHPATQHQAIDSFVAQVIGVVVLVGLLMWLSLWVGSKWRRVTPPEKDVFYIV